MTYPKLNAMVAACCYRYPTLFRVPCDSALSRLLVLDHIFLCIGTALEWHPDGYLQDAHAELFLESLPEGFWYKALWILDLHKCNKYTGEYIDQAAQLQELTTTLDARDKLHYTLTNKREDNISLVFEATPAVARAVFAKYSVRDPRMSAFWQKLGKEDQAVTAYPADALSLDRDEGRSYSPYPISKQYSPIAQIAGGCRVQPDWLAGAVEIGKAALAYYEDPEAVKDHVYYPAVAVKPIACALRDAAEKGSEVVAHLHKVWKFTEGETPEDHCQRSWEEYHACQLEFLRTFLNNQKGE